MRRGQNMHNFSAKIPDELYKKLKAKAKEMGLAKKNSMSEVVRLLLSAALEPKESQPNTKVQNKILEHTVTIYYLLKEYVKNQLGENGSMLNNLAHDKCEKVLENILRKKPD
jgi:hypothetical protein